MKTNRYAPLLMALCMCCAPFAPAAEHAEKETIPYLGVGTMTVDPLLAKHLKLKPGTGLLVQLVDPASAAAGQLEEEDILVQLDDQLLINPEQFQTLVRTRTPGETVTLLIRRAGAEKKVGIKLGERIAPEPEGMISPARGWAQWPESWPDLRNWMQNQPRIPGRRAPDGMRNETRISTHSSVVVERNGTRAELTDDGKTRHFKVTDPKGKVLFEGEPDDKAIESMTKDVRELYNEVTGKTSIEIRQVEEPEPKQPAEHGSRLDV